MRLDKILGRRRLSFNPYTVSDRRLMEIAETTGWGSEWDLTQITIMHFTRLRLTGNYRVFDGIFMKVGREEEEVYIPASALAMGTTANDTNTRERTWLGKKPIRNNDDVERLVGKTVFVSRIIRGTNMFGNFKGAYKMHRLTGKIARDAKVIREAMCEAKIEMLERMLMYPESPDYLSCKRGVIEYEPRVQLAIDLIRRFPETKVPED